LIAAIGSAASEADRCAVSRIGELTVARSIIFGRAETNDTMTAMSQLLPFSNREMDILRAWKYSFSTTSWMLTSSSSYSESDELPSMGERSSSEERYFSWRERVSLESRFVESSTAAVTIRRVSVSWWDKSGEEAELSERWALGFSKDHCWSWVETTTSTMVAVKREKTEGWKQANDGTVRRSVGRQAIDMCSRGLPEHA
jgi:hypothetical protein